MADIIFPGLLASTIGIISKLVEETVNKSIPIVAISLVPKKSKDKKYMKKTYGCKFCAFYQQRDIPEDELKKLLVDDTFEKIIELGSIKKIQKRKKLPEEDYKKKLRDMIVKYVEKYFGKLKEQLPYLCIIKNRSDTKPCFRYTFKTLGISLENRLNYQNSKIARRYTSLGVFLATFLSSLATVISILTLLK